MSNTDLIDRIKQHLPEFSKSQRLIAEYILEHYDKAAFMTASKLGKKINVSESTVVRFANAIGFEGYPELQKSLQDLVKMKLTTIQRLELAEDYTENNNIVQFVLKSDLENIKATLDTLDIDVFNKVVDSLFNARRIYIIGLRSSMALAEFLGFYLNLILDNVRVVSYGVSDIFEQLLRVGENDVVIGIGFPRYSRRTIDALRYAKEKKAKVIAITDSNLSPLTESADCVLLAKSNIASFVDSLVAPLSLINALIVSVGLREKNIITTYFDHLEKIWDKYGVYSDKTEGAKDE
ncbi:transcriptional regulator, RpiR family [Caldanaerobius fijiensis DSM 17918]|uniref:Transcriptional regulator, RpiR family n=1 Tax=Caldanaerobius fijiensis DSM 17918 TaxID=1121256 RepID=A0A1M4UD70_9THEO|nr:MurR/RpiR family transcriptional regulator [Caldanaerobius fijiensis]SHE54732.1 transcriptional regulator, RpiR family [Caldanaerobius fijiensis DSM 17918]